MLTKFGSEEELEKVVVENYPLIFGNRTIYFDIKKQVRSKSGNIYSIPDGYLINFSEQLPKLYVIVFIRISFW